MKTYAVPLLLTIVVILIGGAVYVVSELNTPAEPISLRGVEITTPDSFVVVADEYNQLGVSRTEFDIDGEQVELSFDTTRMFIATAGVIALPFAYTREDLTATYVGFFSTLQGQITHEATAFLGEKAAHVTFIQNGGELIVSYQVDGRDSFRVFVLKNGSVTDSYEVINGDVGDVFVEQPLPNETISDTVLVLEGAARGYWFFEADMPVELRDQTGNVLATSFVTAQSDWMTEDVVEFTGIIEVPNDYEGEGYLIVKRDNPSDLLENNASLRMPLSIHPNAE